MQNHRQRARKRFIAGAKCPQCQAQDSIMLYFEHNVEKIACTQCDYVEAKSSTDVSQKTTDNELIGLFKPVD